MSRPVALVTGAGRGIGAAIVRDLAAHGWHVVALDRCSPDPAVPYEMATADDLAAVVTKAGFAEPVHADVADGERMAEVVAGALAEHGRLDAVVCAAGIVAGGAPVWEVPDSEWNAVIATDLTGVFTTVRAAMPAVLEAEAGRIVVVASAAGSLGLRHMAPYAAAKHGVIGLVRFPRCRSRRHGCHPPTRSRRAPRPHPASTSQPGCMGLTRSTTSSVIKNLSVD